MKSCKYLLMLAIAVIGITACSDEDFSSSPALSLTFSTDTVKFDTIFSKVPTSTRTMWVYNRSGKDLRCTNVRLLNGNQTGYRVNVDGVYLSPAAGYQMQDVEIRNKDSLRVFVELTSPKTGKLEPQELSDKLLFTLESGNTQELVLDAFSWDAEEVNNLVVSSDMTLESTSPLLVNGMIIVEEGATLTIPAGQTIYFSSNAGIEVNGTLRVEGTAEKNVTLRGSRLDNMFDYLPYDRTPGQWQGVRMDGIVCDESDLSKLKLDIENSIVHNCQGYGIKAISSSVKIENCQITNTLNDCVAFFGGNGYVGNSTLAQFYPFDSRRGAALRFTNFYEENTLPLYNLNCVNSIVTGYAEDVIMGETNESETVFSYSFANCILRTPEVKDEKSASFFTDIIWEEPEDTVYGGDKNFKLVDIDTQHYDFHLSDKSKAIGAASTTYAPANDRDGKTRDDKPDMGCYEFREE